MWEWEQGWGGERRTSREVEERRGRKKAIARGSRNALRLLQTVARFSSLPLSFFFLPHKKYFFNLKKNKREFFSVVKQNWNDKNRKHFISRGCVCHGDEHTNFYLLIMFPRIN